VKKVGKNRKKISKTGFFWRMQKLANFIIQTSRVDVAGYEEQVKLGSLHVRYHWTIANKTAVSPTQAATDDRLLYFYFFVCCCCC
jgi:hypothetical protein